MTNQELPRGWVRVRLNDVVRPARSKVDPRTVPDLPFIGMEHVESGSTRLVGTVPAATMRSAGVHFYPGDVLYGRLRPYLNKVHLSAFEGVSSAEFIVLTGNAAVDAAFLMYRLNSADLVEFASHLNEGDRPRVDWDQLGLFEVWLPPIAEQRHIVAVLEEHLTDLDAAVAGLKRAKANLKRFISSVLVTAAYRGLRHHVERDSGTAVSRFAGRTGLPAGWTWTTVAEVGDVLLGRQRAPQYLTGRYAKPYLRVANVGDDMLDLSDVKEMDFDEVHAQKYALRPGDILVSEGQSPELVGQSAIYRGGVPHLCFQKTLHRFRAHADIVLPEYAQIVFRAFVRSGDFQRHASLTVNIAHLTLERFKAVPFPLPPLEEQRAIVGEVERRLAIASHTGGEIDLQLARARSLRQSVLKRAFEGQLVPQDPSNEPASATLGRTQAKAPDSTATTSRRRDRRGRAAPHRGRR